jgi:DNA-binding transcriptional ArsR family regulator
VSTSDDCDNGRLLSALNHRLRRQVLRAMPENGELSPRDLAEMLGEPLGNVSYHVRVLAESGALQLVEERRVRGTTQHFYRSSVTAGWVRALLDDPGWEESASPPGGKSSRRSSL